MSRPSSRRSAFPRRLFLRGLGGLAIGLPLFEPGFARAQTSAVPKRFILFFEHGGTLCNVDSSGKRISGNGEGAGDDAWRPAAETEALSLGPIHQPLAGMEEHLLLLRGIDNMAGKRQGPYGGDHGWANVTALTCADAYEYVNSKGEAVQGSEGPSFDAVLAPRLAARQPVAFPSINLEVSAHNYGSPFFKAARQYTSDESNPRTAFNSIFANVVEGGGAVDPAVARARLIDRSILDGTTEGLNLLRRRVGADDFRTVDAHLEHIRELERRLRDTAVPAECRKPTIGTTYTSQQTIGPAMVNILIAAFKCGLTNVATLNIGDLETGWLNPPYPAEYNIGHSLHHAARYTGKTGAEASKHDDWYKSMVDNRQWRMGLLRRFMDEMARTLEPGGTGSMLDNSVILWTSEFSRGERHSVADLPVLLAGKGGGRIRTGRHVNYNTKAATNPATTDYATQASTHNLFTTLLNVFDYPDTHFGTTDHPYVLGPLSGIT